MKKRIYAEAAYVVGLLLLALGTALMARADFGLSMVTAPAYLLHLKVSQYWPFFTFGMAGYVVEGLLLVALSVVMRRFRTYYLFSFISAVLFGLLLDLFTLPVGLIPADHLAVRAVCYAVGMPMVSSGVAMLFNTYLPPEAYDLFVKEMAARFGFPLSRTKTVYDLISCLVAVGMSFAFFGLGRFEGVKAGTVVCALLNGWLIGRFSRLYDRCFTFTDRLPWRARFTG